MLTGGAQSSGDSSSVASDLNDDAKTNPVTMIYSTERAFAALKENGSVVTWGFGLDEDDYDSISKIHNFPMLGYSATQIKVFKIQKEF